MVHLSCKKDDSKVVPVLFLKTGAIYTVDGAEVPLGGQIRIGVMASGSESPITYIRIDKITAYDTILQLDKGIYLGAEGLNADYSFSKDTASVEVWMVTIMNADRQIASKSFTVKRGAGSAFGAIWYYPSLTIGHQNSTNSPHYLDADKGLVYTEASLPGHESEIDIVCYYYVTSGKNSPTLTCPGYTAAQAYYPAMGSWPNKNMTLYDYYSTDNNLISVAQFDGAVNDSTLVNAFKPGSVSGNCKYCYTGKVIPFKTQQSKYGLIKVIKADENETGTMELAIKIQQ
jgi:hypothetical protein